MTLSAHWLCRQNCFVGTWFFIKTAQIVVICWHSKKYWKWNIVWSDSFVFSRIWTFMELWLEKKQMFGMSLTLFLAALWFSSSSACYLEPSLDQRVCNNVTSPTENENFILLYSTETSEYNNYECDVIGGLPPWLNGTLVSNCWHFNSWLKKLNYIHSIMSALGCAILTSIYT